MREFQDAETTLDTSKEFQALLDRWVNTKVSKEAIEQAIASLNFIDTPVIGHEGKVIDDYRYSMNWSLEHPDLDKVKNPPRVACATSPFIHQITSQEFNNDKLRDDHSCAIIRRYTQTNPSNEDIKSILTTFQTHLSEALSKLEHRQSATESSKAKLNDIKTAQDGNKNDPGNSSTSGGCAIM